MKQEKNPKTKTFTYAKYNKLWIFLSVLSFILYLLIFAIIVKHIFLIALIITTTMLGTSLYKALDSRRTHKKKYEVKCENCVYYEEYEHIDTITKETENVARCKNLVEREYIAKEKIAIIAEGKTFGTYHYLKNNKPCKDFELWEEGIIK